MDSKTEPAREYILCSAIHYDDGKEYIHQPRNIATGFVICGRRHHNIINTLAQVFGRETKDRTGQGFLTNTDRFVDRKEAYIIAKNANQLNNKLHDQSNPQLISEDLYSENLY